MTIDYPTIEEIAALTMNAERYEDENVPWNQWDGNGFRKFFEEVSVPVAEEINADPWDVFAVFMAKIRGTTFEFDEENDEARIIFE